MYAHHACGRHVHLTVRTYIPMHTCMPICPCSYAHIYDHARMPMPVCLCPYARMRMPVCPCPHAHACTHAGGSLILRDGSVHVGHFESGVAAGEGIYFDCKGSVHVGACRHACVHLHMRCKRARACTRAGIIHMHVLMYVHRDVGNKLSGWRV